MLLSNFNLLASAPEGVARLRKLILTLAVRGQLVPQDPADESASVLLRKVSSERDRRISEGKIKRDRPLPPITNGEQPFDLPAGWVWVRLADVVCVLNGRAYAKNELLDVGPVPVLRVGNLFTSKHWYYSNLELDSDKYCTEGDLLYAWSASFGPFIWEGPKAIFHYHIWKLEPWAPACFDTGYFHKFLMEKTAEIKASGHGVSMIHMTKDKMEKIVVPLPPLAEQSRIATRIEKLFRLCDALDAKSNQETSQHVQLISTLLGALTSSKTPEGLVENWQRIAQHFDLLLDRPEAIDALEQSLLQLAVRGLLVPQDRTDEPASTLLARVRTEKQRLIAEGQIKRDTPLPPITDEEKPFGLPVGWSWQRLSDVVEMLNGYAFKSERFKNTGVRLLRNLNVSHGYVDWSHATAIDATEAADFQQFALRAGDIVLSLDRPIISTGLKYAVIQDSDLPCLLLQRVARLAPDVTLISVEFLSLWLQSDLFVGTIDPGRSNGVPHISTKQVGGLVIALPPLTEQSRIVTRISAMRRLCADLRKPLKAAQVTQFHLAQALVGPSIAL